MEATILAQSIVNGLMAGWIYVLVALGLALILSVAGIVQLAHGEVYMLGAYGAYYLLVRAGLNFFLALVLSAFLVGLLGIVLYGALFRPFRQQLERSLIFALGVMLILQTAAKLAFGETAKAITSPFPGVLRVFGVTLSWERLIVIVVGIVFSSTLILFVQRTKTGQAMYAMSQDQDAAALVGINVDRISAVAMALGSGMAAIAGALVGTLFSVSPDMGSFALMKGIAVIILGGLGSIPGAIIGGLILGMIDGLVPPLLSSHIASTMGFVVVILILLFRPQGIMGHE